MRRERKRSNLQPGCLLTREERWQLRLSADELERRIGRAAPAEQQHLELSLAGIRREQQLDRATRPRGRGKKTGR